MAQAESQARARERSSDSLYRRNDMNPKRRKRQAKMSARKAMTLIFSEWMGCRAKSSAASQAKRASGRSFKETRNIRNEFRAWSRRLSRRYPHGFSFQIQWSMRVEATRKGRPEFSMGRAWMKFMGFRRTQRLRMS